jgi:hypothetical protein
MSVKNNAGMMAAVMVLAAACGGGGDKTESPRDPYVEFRVNGVLSPTAITLPWIEFETDDDGGFCDPDFYENAEDVVVKDPGYCEKSITAIQFSGRYTNATYEDVVLNYRGLGMEVHIFEYDDSVSDFKGPEIWNSSYYTQRLIIGLDDPDVDNFDPNEAASVTLQASHSFPSVSGFVNVVFEADQIFETGFEDYIPAEASTRIITNPANGAECDWILQVNDDLSKYEKVRCFGDELLPEPGTGTEEVKFVASVTFSFNDWTDQPDDIIITLTPPD